ncbi:MAG: PhoH family protein [Deltaproteobacteria bacterium]|nr:PhoH family protein [Deltaproteobacteria bacterium]
MPKTYVLDTNVLLHNPRAIFVFQDNRVVLPLAVIEEIDNQKRRQDEIGRNAREVSRHLDQLRRQGQLAQGVELPGGGTLQIEVNHRSLENLPLSLDALDGGKPDNRILAVALNLARQNGSQVTLVSKDLNLRLKADVLGLTAEDFNNDKVDFARLYPGQAEFAVDQDTLDRLYRQKCLAAAELPGAEDLHPHQFVVLKNAGNGSSSALARHLDGQLTPLALQGRAECFGVKSRNKEQLFALDLLLDERVKVVTLAGGAGTGKTLLALAAGLELVVEEGAYHKLLVTRPVIPLEGQELGFLPGDKDEKLRPWMQPIHDNLELLFGYAKPRQPGLFRGKGATGGTVDPEDYLSLTGQLEMEALTYIRGRSIPGQFILVDEAQNCTPHAIKTLLTRVGERSKIVFTGDIEQIDHPYLDADSNGFTILVERLKGAVLAGHVTLQKGERSEVAELGARLL